jgi:type II secretion system protein J
MCSRRKGFTLVEIILASTIGVFVALVAVGTLKAISASAERVDNNIDAACEVRFASERIAADLMNLYRDSPLKNTKLIGTIELSEEGLFSHLILYTVGRIKARADQPEGDVYEVEYYLMKDEGKSALLRRLWPNPDKDAQPGGVLSVIAEDVDVFEVSFFDGEKWQIEWPEEMQSLPKLVEVNIAVKQPNRRDMIKKSFLVNFVRFAPGGANAFQRQQEKAK